MNKILRFSYYLILNRRGFVKATKTGSGKITGDQLEIKCNIEIPEQAFRDPLLIANLKITPEQLPDIVTELDMELIRLKQGEGE